MTGRSSGSRFRTVRTVDSVDQNPFHAFVAMLSQFVWPNQWSGIQEIHMTSGNFTGAFQVGKIVYPGI